MFAIDTQIFLQLRFVPRMEHCLISEDQSRRDIINVPRSSRNLYFIFVLFYTKLILFGQIFNTNPNCDISRKILLVGVVLTETKMTNLMIA